MAKKNNTLESLPAGAIIKSLVIQPAKLESADIGTWRTALNNANRGNRAKLYDLIDNVMMDPVLSSAVDRRINKITNAEITFQRHGESVEEIDDLIDTPEFELLIEEIARARAYGKSVIEVGFSPEFDVFSFPRKHIKITNLDKPLSERKRFIAAKPADQNGYDYTQDEFIFECGKDDDFGYIFKAAAYVIYKRGGFGDWAQYAEIFGMPFLVGKYNSADEKQRDMLFEALSMIGGKPVAAVPDGTSLDVHDTGGSSTDLYDRFKKACNEEILIAVLGQSMTTTDGSSRSQAEVHEDTEEGISQSDRRYVQRMLNRYLVPLLVKRGYKAEGGFFLFPDAGENISTKERLDMGFLMRREGLEVDEDYFFEISGIPRSKTKKPDEPVKPNADKEKPEVKPETKEEKTDPAKDEKLNDGFIGWLKDFFVFARTTGSRANRHLQEKSTSYTHTGIDLADEVKIGLNIDNLFEKALRNIYKKRGGKMPIVEENLFNISNTAYQTAIDKQFKSAGVEFGKKNQAFIDEFKTNAAVFAVFKNHRQTVEITQQLLDDKGNLRSFHEFKKAVLGTSIKADYNKRWLLTEYNTAVRSARSAASFKKFEATKHLYPNLEFMPSTAANPREEHKEYYGTILPIDHTWWNDHTPPLDWGCECSIRNTDKPVSKVPADAEPIDPVFDNNPGKTAEIVNMGEHPYVKGVCKVYSTCSFRKNLKLAEVPNRPECGICLIVQNLHRNLKARKQTYQNFDSKTHTKEYFNAKNGGYLVIDNERIKASKASKNEKLKFEKEKQMCLNYAKAGYSVEMLKESTRTPSPDVRFNGIPGELKKTVSHNNIVKEAKNAVKQKGAKVLLFEFSVDYPKIHSELHNLLHKHGIKVYYYFTGREKSIFRNF